MKKNTWGCSARNTAWHHYLFILYNDVLGSPELITCHINLPDTVHCVFVNVSTAVQTCALLKMIRLFHPDWHSLVYFAKANRKAAGRSFRHEHSVAPKLLESRASLKGPWGSHLPVYNPTCSLYQCCNLMMALISDILYRETHLVDCCSQKKQKKNTHYPHSVFEHICITITALPFSDSTAWQSSIQLPSILPLSADLLILCFWHKHHADFAGWYPCLSMCPLSFSPSNS